MQVSLNIFLWLFERYFFTGWNFFDDKVPDEIGIIHTNCKDKAKKFEELLRTHFPKAKYYYGEFGSVIGMVTGPGAMVFVGFSNAKSRHLRQNRKVRWIGPLNVWPCRPKKTICRYSRNNTQELT
ncbi:MAG: DegV family protein [Candidatus Marinimicrobia bacterium]|nr:DegV family protein [Candidatus Neomarinimicrobiota bacterium]